MTEMEESERIDKIINSLKNFNGYNKNNLVLIKAPGRVNLVGGHTDYNLGYVLPCAVDKNIIIGSIPSKDEFYRFNSLNFKSMISFKKKDLNQIDKKWINYIKGIIHQYKKIKDSLICINSTIHGTTPIGSG
ncbi:MAG: hypothetical protein GF329_03910, partial [Candidatus Lokiarchaeota archaeon]|nr:hypothetical protein [Candidatus Lokiarchaeota archaeon]